MGVFKTRHIQVDFMHCLYVEEWGNPQGTPVVFLHGGPGGSISPQSRTFFDEEKHRVILFDQRGCGKSTPFGERKDNTPFHSVEDMEKIRQALGIERWVVFGGSYGSTLALVYGILHPERVIHFVLRGIFLGRKSDVHWLYQEGASWFYPERFAAFRDLIEPGKRHDLVSAYYELLTGKDKEKAKKAAKAWSDWESGIVRLIPPESLASDEKSEMSLALLECSYFYHQMFWGEDNYLLNHIEQMKDIPMDIVHGRYDVDCRPSGAYELHEALPNSKLHLVEAAGHSPYDEPMMKKLREIMKNL